MPKPGKSSKLPSDLRPLGIQGPTSKIVAGALRARLEAEVEVLLGSMPQYAYSKGKSIDEYICRVGGFCKEVAGTIATRCRQCALETRGPGRGPCVGGILAGIDLSRAFDTPAHVAVC